MGYLNARDYKALDKTGDELPSDVNELFIIISRGSDLKARREGIVANETNVHFFHYMK